MMRIHDIYGHTVRVRTSDTAIAAGARDVLGQFPEAGHEDGHILDITLSAVASPGDIPFARSQSTTVVGELPNRDFGLQGEILRDGARWVIDCGVALIIFDFAAGRAEGWITIRPQGSPEFPAVFVLIAVIELLRTRSVYTIHCSALARDGRGVIFIGPGGSGKTTACVSLTRAGYHCLSDDHPLMRERDGQLELLAFPGRLFVADRTVAFFPELDAAQEKFRPGARKRSFALSDIEGYRGGEACKPSLMIFPRIVDSDESTFEPLSRARALEELLPQTMLVMDPVQAARQFQTISRMARETPAFRLHFGRDVDRLPERIAELTESLHART